MKIEEIRDARKKFFEEGLDYYSKDTRRRSTSTVGTRSACFYRKGKKSCFIGRHIPNEMYDPCIEGEGVTSGDVFNLLPSDVQALGPFFLSNVQSFHDNESFWNKRSGLTMLGKINKKRIITEYCE